MNELAASKALLEIHYEDEVRRRKGNRRVGWVRLLLTVSSVYRHLLHCVYGLEKLY